MALTSYGRYDWHRATLDGYSESGLGAFDLVYGRQRVVNNALALGVQGSFVFTRDWGSLRPHWTVEYRSALDNRGQATINYVMRPAASDYVLDLRSYNDDLLSVGAGVDLQLDNGWMSRRMPPCSRMPGLSEASCSRRRSRMRASNSGTRKGLTM